MRIAINTRNVITNRVGTNHRSLRATNLVIVRHLLGTQYAILSWPLPTFDDCSGDDCSGIGPGRMRCMRRLAVLVVIPFLVVACGSDSKSSDPPPATAPAGSPNGVDLGLPG